MEMEKRKNKRVTRAEEESERVNKKRLKGEEEEEDGGGGGGDGVPTEEEVEEFFAILRRMRVAVKYFDDKGRGGREWREALETAELAVDHSEEADGGQEGDDGSPKKKRGEVANVIEGFDLNAAAPEAAEGGGA
ncbi:hypothetical protein LR48_Vigan10g020600 [Vigna angularis]|uniref:Uncharacterized protein n=2 Tax=Phaseolus angularis TaxID=3914 RepID=A0A0L9VHX3_PHAAN|nr:uncharacterized protein HKW66_Vig0123040 [Vigna angularis]KOM54314.1 hypothetical protein LR48_Vigan10g020600 [Vigna angularis]BAU02801.1 hypothetical protein VIGAN_11238400 [Vigna angularis var. angularis]